MELFNFHNYDNLRHFAKKHDPRREGGDQRVRTRNTCLTRRKPTHTCAAELAEFRVFKAANMAETRRLPTLY